MSEKLEQVIEAMRLRAIDRGHPIHPTLVRHLDVAAIEEMVDKPDVQCGYDQSYVTSGQIEEIWRNMIDAILDETKKP